MRKSKQFANVLSGILSAVLLITAVLGVLPMQVDAVSYSGRGSRNDPYLVETPEQLQGMKDNLSAHYKLANTIDMSGTTLTPIGHQGSPFTGSFVCDLDADGTPKYAIKNLTVSVKGVTGYADYVKGKNKWQAALFGATARATITNIALLDVNIKNTVEGKNQMNADYSINPGMDEMAAAALIGMAENTTVTGCSATGIIDSRANYTGGLIGQMKGGTVSKCYANVTVQQTGRWCNGGFVGAVTGGSITECFTGSDMSNAQSSSLGWGAGTNTTAGFVGSYTESVTIQNCYATGNVGAGGASFFSTESGSITDVSNCYATGKVAEVTVVKAGSGCSNAYILNAAGCAQEQFTAASEEEIRSAFASNNVWDVSGTLPKLKNVTVITDTAKYVPGQVTAPPPDDSGNQGDANDTPNPDNGNNNGSDNAPAPDKGITPEEYVAKMADYLNKALNDQLAVEEAFECLTFEEQKSNMTVEELEELATLNPYINDDYNMLLAEVKLFLVSHVVSEIDGLPATDAMKEEDVEKTFAVHALFGRLPEEFQEAINKQTVSKLNSCYDKAYELKYVTFLTQKPDADALDTVETVLIITFGTICVVAFVGVIITTVKMIRFTQRKKETVKTEN